MQQAVICSKQLERRSTRIVQRAQIDFLAKLSITVMHVRTRETSAVKRYFGKALDQRRDRVVTKTRIVTSVKLSSFPHQREVSFYDKRIRVQNVDRAEDKKCRPQDSP